MLPIIDTLKIKAVALYIIKQTASVDLLTLFKIMYFAEMKHISRYGRPITDDSYVAMPNGPVPSVLYAAAKQRGAIEISTALEVIGHKVVALETPDMDELSDSDIECLNEAIRENEHISFHILSKKSHGLAYQKARKLNLSKNNNPIDWIDVATEAGADECMIKYINEIREIHRILANGSQFC